MFRSITSILLLIALLHSNDVRSAESESLEIKVKAAYIYNFLRFVKWPENNNSVSNICVFGIKENYQIAFSSMVAISKKTKKIKIAFFDSDENINNLSSCQIVFITDKADEKSTTVIEFFNNNKDAHALTVGESNEFINKGGMINFIRIEDKVRFEINHDAAKAAGLKISSQVLRIAEKIIKTGEAS